TLIVAAKCDESFGSEGFRLAQQTLHDIGPEAFLENINAKPLAAIDEWQTEMVLRATRHFRVQLYAPGLPAEDRSITCVEMIDSIASAVADSIARSGDSAVAVIPEGPY